VLILSLSKGGAMTKEEFYLANKEFFDAFSENFNSAMKSFLEEHGRIKLVCSFTADPEANYQYYCKKYPHLKTTETYAEGLQNKKLGLLKKLEAPLTLN
jgi:hypothetical protein